MLAGVAAALLPATAAASSVSVVSTPGRAGHKGPGTGIPPTAVVQIVAAPGERNQIVLSLPTTSAMTVQDLGAPLEAGVGCSAVDAHTATCTGAFSPPTALEAATGDGDDAIEASGLAIPTTLAGGEGDDALTGGPRNDLLLPGPGSDTIDGGPDSGVVLRGDTVSYAGRAASAPAISIDLASGVAQAPGGERDTLQAVEHAIGGDGDDELLGDRSRNRLSGERGNDRVDGRGGADTIAGGRGDDRLSGGSGNDTIGGGSGADVLRGEAGRDELIGGRGPDLFECGAGGRDEIMAPQRADRVLDRCEAVTLTRNEGLDAIDFHGTPVIRARRALIRISCGNSYEGLCVGRLTLKRGRRRLAAASIRLRPSARPTTVRLRLPRISLRRPLVVGFVGRFQLSGGERINGGFAFNARPRSARWGPGARSPAPHRPLRRRLPQAKMSGR